MPPIHGAPCRGGGVPPKGPRGPQRLKKWIFTWFYGEIAVFLRGSECLITSFAVSCPGLPGELSGDRPLSLWIDSRGALPSILSTFSFATILALACLTFPRAWALTPDWDWDLYDRACFHRGSGPVCPVLRSAGTGKAWSLSVVHRSETGT